MPDIHSLGFATDSWTQIRSSDRQIVWAASSSDMFMIDFLQPTDFKHDLRDPEIRLEFEETASSAGGVLLDFAITSIKGLEAAYQIYKFWHPGPQDMRKVYIGTLAFPFADFCYIVKAQSIETGTTGMREAAVAIIEQPSIEPIGEPIEVNSIEDLFTQMKQGRLQRIPADNETYDDQFPDHPLSKVRGYLRHIAATLQFDPALLTAPPYRIARPSEA